MKNIKFLKVVVQVFILRNLIYFYKMCYFGSYEVYIYLKKIMCKIKSLIEFEMFCMVYDEKEYLIVVEGIKVL